jgi:trehalose utilization protein
MIAVFWCLALLAGTPLRVIVWSEGTAPKDVYPDDIRGAIARSLVEGDRAARFDVKTATLADPEQGLSEAALDAADVLVWWGHAKHGEVRDDVALRITTRVRAGKLGFVALHSAHKSKPFMALMGTSGDIASWREDGKPEHVTVAAPSHPVAAGLPPEFTIAHDEMYAEPFQIPEPETVVFRSRFEGGETFPSGCAFRVGAGRVFYFRPGHETFPTYFDPNVERVIANAIAWAAPRAAGPPLPRLPLVARFVARDGGGQWKVDPISPREFDWKERPHESPPPLASHAIPAESILERVSVFPGSGASLAAAAEHPIRADELRFNREHGTIAEVYGALYPGAPRLRRLSVPVYASIERIDAAFGRYVDWPEDFERLGPEEGSLVLWPDAAGGPVRTWRAFTEDNPGALLKNFEYGLALRQRWIGAALVNEYCLSGPRSDWVKAWNGVDALVPLATPNGSPAWLLTTVMEFRVEFNIGDPGDSRILDGMADTLLALKKLAESR